MSPNRIKQSFTLFCMLMMIVGVSTISAQDPITIKIPDPKKFSTDIDEFILEKSYLPLETKSDCLLPGHSPRIYIYNELIYVLYRPREGLYIFTSQGKFVNSYKSYGQGPNEVLSMYCLSFHKEEVFVLDYKGGKILVLDLEGQPKRSIATPSHPYDMIHNEQGQLLLYIKKEDFNGKPYDLIWYDEKLSEFYGYLQAGDYNKAQNRGISSLAMTPQGPIFAPTAGDTIFSINDKVAKPAFILDFGKLSLSEDMKKTYDAYKFKDLKKQFMALEKNFQHVGNIISYLYNTEEKDYMMFCDLETKKFYGGSWTFPELELGSIYLPMGTTKDSYLFSVDALTIIEEVGNHPERCSPELLELGQKLDPGDNPVLMFWKVK